MSFNTATEAEEEEEGAAVESQALPVGDSDECGPPRGCSEPMVPSLAQFTWRCCADASLFSKEMSGQRQAVRRHTWTDGL